MILYHLGFLLLLVGLSVQQFLASLCHPAFLPALLVQAALMTPSLPWGLQSLEVPFYQAGQPNLVVLYALLHLLFRLDPGLEERFERFVFKY